MSFLIRTYLGLIVSLTLQIMLATSVWIPCTEISSDLRLPCFCALQTVEETPSQNFTISVNCDTVSLSNELSSIPYGVPIISFSQKWAGQQTLPSQIFSLTDLPLQRIDLSGNLLRKLSERKVQVFKSSLLELKLADNLFGDTLNPIFSSTEFRGLGRLRSLDLSGNNIKALEEGILEGCDNLQELYLERNSFFLIPTTSLNGPKQLKILSLNHNRIDLIKSEAFKSQKYLESIDLSYNLISLIESNAFIPLEKLKNLKLTYNSLSKFNSDVFQGLDNLLSLDLSHNFIDEFPTLAFKPLNKLKYLNISSNLIQSLDNQHLINVKNIYSLDISRNNIANLSPGTFLGLKQLRKLDIAVNSLRTIEDDAFEGLDNLESLNLKDNNILLIPASALGRLTKLTSLQLDYNRVAALSTDIIKSLSKRLTKIDLSKNIVRELPSGTFRNFNQLQFIDLSRNLLNSLNSDSFSGIENNLLVLDLSQNRITNLYGKLRLIKLTKFDLSDNHLTDINKDFLSQLKNLKHFNISNNKHLSAFHYSIFHNLPYLEIIDLKSIGMRAIRRELFAETQSLKEIHLSHNNIIEINENVFNLNNVTKIDLSFNNISIIKMGAFNTKNINELALNGNRLGSFKGEIFNTGTSLESLDLSDNEIAYLFASSFRIHPRIKSIKLRNNKLSYFPAELIRNLQFLQYIDLANNRLISVEELDFAMLPRLKTLILSNNQLDYVSDMSFHNSTQLQIIDLSYNRLKRLNERTFESLLRLQSINLQSNRLNDLHESIFDKSKLRTLENIDLSDNLFDFIPVNTIQKQQQSIISVTMSRNKIKELPITFNYDALINIKVLDLSFNPLSEEALMKIVSEPKTARELNLAGVGIRNVPRLETPFLTRLNLSFNNISILNENSLERVTLLKELDISHNNIKNLHHFLPIWKLLPNLESINLSSNQIESISDDDFSGLDKLRRLSIKSLSECKRIDKKSFRSINKLTELRAYGYPHLGYLDIQGILQDMNLLEKIHIETRDTAIGKDQLHFLLHSRLKELDIRGYRLKSISSGTLSGFKGSELTLRLVNTSLTSLPPALFFPVPRSSNVVLDVTGSQLSSVSPQLLATFDDRRGDIKLIGLESNPIICDCSSRALRRWLPSHMTSIKCQMPEHLKGKYLVEIGDDELTCDAKRTITTSTQSTIPTKDIKFYNNKQPKITEPEIIWSMPTTEKIKSKLAQFPITNDDTLIIGIVSGVVAFITILIIIICIVRLKMTGNNSNTLNNGNHPMVGIGVGSSCACSVKGGPSMYAIQSVPSYTTLPRNAQMLRQPPSTPVINIQPYFVSMPSDEKNYY